MITQTRIRQNARSRNGALKMSGTTQGRLPVGVSSKKPPRNHTNGTNQPERSLQSSRKLIPPEAYGNNTPIVRIARKHGKKSKTINCNYCPSKYACVLGSELIGNRKQDLFGLRIGIEFKKEDVIFSEGERPEGIFIVCSGVVKISSINSRTGAELTTRTHGPGELFGHSDLFSEWPYAHSAEVLRGGFRTANISFIPSDKYFAFLLKTPRILAPLLKTTSIDVKKAENFALMISKYDSKQRIIKVLRDLTQDSNLSIKNRKGKTIEVILTRKEISEKTGLAPETVTRELGEIEEEGHRGRKIIQKKESGIVLFPGTFEDYYTHLGLGETGPIN